MKTTKLVALFLATAFSGAALAQSTPRVDRRENRQQKRIEQGERSGRLTNKEAGHLEAHEAKLNADEAAAKADGKVTRKERVKLNREANRNSKRIYKQKHDAQHK